MSEQTATPSSHWRAEGQADPHAGHYDCERAALAMGNLTDDELANAAFVNYDVRPPLQDIIAGKAYSPIAYMTAVKDRIRWLSRSLEKVTAERDALADELKAPREPAAWQERQAVRSVGGVVTEWTDWYGCKARSEGSLLSDASSGIPYEWRPLYAHRARKLNGEDE